MTAEERANLQKLVDLHPRADEGNAIDFEYEEVTMEDIDNGDIPLEISHAGGEYDEIKKAYVHYLTATR